MIEHPRGDRMICLELPRRGTILRFQIALVLAACPPPHRATVVEETDPHAPDHSIAAASLERVANSFVRPYAVRACGRAPDPLATFAHVDELGEQGGAVDSFIFPCLWCALELVERAVDILTDSLLALIRDMQLGWILAAIVARTRASGRCLRTCRSILWPSASACSFRLGRRPSPSNGLPSWACWKLGPTDMARSASASRKMAADACTASRYRTCGKAARSIRFRAGAGRRPPTPCADDAA